MRTWRPTIVAIALAASGCTWVSVSPQAQKAGVVALSLERVASCRQLSQIQVSVADNVGVLQRMPSDVEHDLTNLAINEAAKSGGDTVAALSPAKDGQQTFGIYKCLNGSGSQSAASPIPAASTSANTAKTTPYRPPLD
ncbi:MAG TPA: DUF4156 domain-containing protein [Gammaproteobacteria bacterium]|nr:DUF4156 domain-containing protein [Gammaproteobacteria bacterium]